MGYMDQDSHKSHLEAAILAEPTGNYNRSQPERQIGSNDFTGIEKLESLLALSTSNDSKRLSLPKQLYELREIDIDSLEMIEAELVNQGILPRTSGQQFSIAQHAMHLISILRWRAVRSGAKNTDQIEFRINVPEYILSRHRELCSNLELPSSLTTGSETSTDSGQTGSANLNGELLIRRTESWGQRKDSHKQILEQLEYLLRFASYLTGDLDYTSTRYERGLALVLRAVTTETTRAAQALLQSQPTKFVTLPISVQEFLMVLRQNV